MAAGARDLDIVFSRFPADVAAVILMGWNEATAWHVFAWLRISIRHFIFLLPFFNYLVRLTLFLFCHRGSLQPNALP
jgi:hypothetical protein